MWIACAKRNYNKIWQITHRHTDREGKLQQNENSMKC